MPTQREKPVRGGTLKSAMLMTFWLLLPLFPADPPSAQSRQPIQWMLLDWAPSCFKINSSGTHIKDLIKGDGFNCGPFTILLEQLQEFHHSFVWAADARIQARSQGRLNHALREPCA